MTVPVPPQRPQGWLRAKKPWLWLTTPRPWHCGQVVGAVPGAAPLPPQVSHCTVWGTLILVVTPLRASSNESFTATLTSSPRSARCCRRPPPPDAAAAEPPPPPNRLPNRSAQSPPMGWPPW